jgi:hypothetical protein
MSFANPFFLFALAAISIPIIVHLFHFRRFKKVYFSNISYLEQLTHETRKQARLKHLLVLFSRILGIIFLVMAFARPYIPVSDGRLGAEGSHVSIYVDNSFSMEANSVYGNLLDVVKQNAAELAEAFSPADKFQILTNDFEPHHQRFVSREEFIYLLGEIDFSPAVRMLSDIMKRQEDLLKNEPGDANKYAFILSDFQKNISDFDRMETDSLIEYFFAPFPSYRSDNVFIDSIWIDNPVRMRGQPVTVNIRIFNDSDTRLENQPVRLRINGVQRSITTFDANPGSGTNVSLSWTIGQNPIQQGVVEISDSPVIFDNIIYFSFRISENIPVLVINQQNENRFLNALLGRDTTFVFRNINVSAIDYSLFQNQNLIILNELASIGSGLALELRKYVEDGGNLLVFPTENMNIESYRDFLASMKVNHYTRLDTINTRVSSFNELHSIYTGVFDRVPENIDLPVVNKYFVIDRQTRSDDEQLMQLQNGNNFFTSVRTGQGQVFLSSVPANDSFSNFPRHAMFVPTIYNIALHSHSFQPLYGIIGYDEAINLRDVAISSNELFVLRSQDMEVIPEVRSINNNLRVFLHDQIHKAGQYQLLKGTDTLQTLSFNYDRRESFLELFSPAEIRTLINQYKKNNINVFEPGAVSFEKQMELFRGGKQLWKFFIVLALMCLLAEVLFLRFMK